MSQNTLSQVIKFVSLLTKRNLQADFDALAFRLLGRSRAVAKKHYNKVWFCRDHGEQEIEMTRQRKKRFTEYKNSN